MKDILKEESIKVGQEIEGGFKTWISKFDAAKGIEPTKWACYVAGYLAGFEKALKEVKRK